MREMIKIGLIALGGYLLLRNLFSSDEGPEQTDAYPEQPSHPIRVETYIGRDWPRTVKELARKAGYGDDPMLNIHQWNWFYEQVRGVRGPAPEDVGTDPALLMTAEEWWRRTGQWYAGRNLAGVPAFARWTC